LDNLYPDSRRLKLSTKWETSQSQVGEGYPSDAYRSNKYFPEAFPLKNVLTSERQGLIQFFLPQARLFACYVRITKLQSVQS
jgi:hypothetical protein